jgi:hypothetical protein
MPVCVVVVLRLPPPHGTHWSSVAPTSQTELSAATAYRDAEVPFVIRNVPSLVSVAVLVTSREVCLMCDVGGRGCCVSFNGACIARAERRCAEVDSVVSLAAERGIP